MSIVVSMYNEAEGIAEFWATLRPVLSSLPFNEVEVLWINDGSQDGTQEEVDTLINADNSPHVHHVAVEFSRNFGHEAAMIAGLDISTGAALICLDADLQHPPKEIIRMCEQYSNGVDIVLMARKTREDNSRFKRFLSSVFYSFMNRLSDIDFEKNSSDFFLISKPVINVLRDNFRERNRFMRGYIQAVGFTKSTLDYDAPSRQSGASNYSFVKLLKLSFNAVFAFSNKPLQISVTISAIFIVFTLTLGIYSLCVYFFGNTPPSGYTTLIIFQSVCFSILFFLIMILSIYFGKSLDETRQRPIYIVKNLKK